MPRKTDCSAKETQSKPEWIEGLANDLWGNRHRGGVGNRRNLTLREAAEQSGVSAPTLSRIERGETPDCETLRKLCKWLGKSADEVLQMDKLK